MEAINTRSWITTTAYRAKTIILPLNIHPGKHSPAVTHVNLEMGLPESRVCHSGAPEADRPQMIGTEFPPAPVREPCLHIRLPPRPAFVM